MGLHELSPVGRWATGGRDGRWFERFAEVCQDFPDRPRIVESDPGDMAAAIEWAECLRSLGQPLHAVEVLRRLAATLPAGLDTDLSPPLATALVAAGQPAEAAEMLRAALAAP